MNVKNVLLFPFLYLVATNIAYAEYDGSKGVGYRSPIVVKDKVTFDYIRDFQFSLEAESSINLNNSISTTGLNSFETLKLACKLEGASNTSLDFMNKNKQFLNPKHAKSMYSTTNSYISKAKKITSGRCPEVLSILKKQFEVFKEITQQEIINHLRNGE